MIAVAGFAVYFEREVAFMHTGTHEKSYLNPIIIGFIVIVVCAFLINSILYSIFCALSFICLLYAAYRHYVYLIDIKMHGGNIPSGFGLMPLLVVYLAIFCVFIAVVSLLVKYSYTDK